MSLKQQLLDAVKPLEEKVEFNGITVVARELDCASDVKNMQDKEDSAWLLLVRCVFDEGGALVFGDEDIPELKKMSLRKISKLVQTVQRVNGLDLEANEKK